MKLFVTDKCLGLIEALAEFYREAAGQRCEVQFYHNVFTETPSRRVKGVATMLKAIHATEDKAGARQKASAVVAKLPKMRLAKAAALVQEGVKESLSYCAFPRKLRRVSGNPSPPAQASLTPEYPPRRDAFETWAT